jgi:hypothetical protein
MPIGVRSLCSAFVRHGNYHVINVMTNRLLLANAMLLILRDSCL